MRLTRWLAGAAAALGLSLALAPLGQAQAMPASSGAASALQSIVGEGTTQARFGGHFGGGHFGGGHFHGGGGGFHHFYGGGFYRPHSYAGPRFYHRPHFYAAYPGPYYYAPVYRCPLVWTVYGPRRICAYRRHFVHYYYGRRFAHRYHYVRHFRHARWM